MVIALLGVEHFYLIDNGSTDDYKPHITDFPVTICVDNKKHTAHYNTYFLSEIQKEAEWVMAVDLDEFVYVRNGYSTIPEYLDTLDINIGQVSIQWKMFGSNGHIQQPDGIVKNFTKRLNYDNPVDESFKNVKRICRTMYLRQLGVHTHAQNGKHIYIYRYRLKKY
jgi:hypothetical protein